MKRGDRFAALLEEEQTSFTMYGGNLEKRDTRQHTETVGIEERKYATRETGEVGRENPSTLSDGVVFRVGTREDKHHRP